MTLLYDAAFGRHPDAAGLVGWAEQVKAGASLSDVAQGFAGSNEFQQAIAGKDNGQIVDYLYETALHREPDASGLSSWTAQLDHGTAVATVLLAISQSAEHVSLDVSNFTAGVVLS